MFVTIATLGDVKEFGELNHRQKWYACNIKFNSWYYLLEGLNPSTS